MKLVTTTEADFENIGTHGRALVVRLDELALREQNDEVRTMLRKAAQEARRAPTVPAIREIFATAKRTVASYQG